MFALDFIVPILQMKTFSCERAMPWHQNACAYFLLNIS